MALKVTESTKGNREVGLSFTIENVVKVVGRVRKWSNLGDKLGLSSFALDEIEQSHTELEDRLKAVVVKYFERGHFLSWRRVIFALDCINETMVADNIRIHAEVPQDLNFTVENVRAVLAEVKGALRKVFPLCELGEDKLNDIERGCTTKMDRALAYSTYFVNTYYKPKMEAIAQAMYDYKEMKAAKRTKQYIPLDDPTLTAKNVADIMMRVEGGLREVWGGDPRYIHTPYYRIGIPDSVLRDISSKHSTKREQVMACSTFYLDVSPYGWEKIVAMLSRKGEKSVAEKALKYIPKAQIIKQPTDQSTTLGGEVVFTVDASRPDTLTYQWNKDGDILTKNSLPSVIGATTPTLRILCAAAQHEGNYMCVISNKAHIKVNSQCAKLVVVCPQNTGAGKNINANSQRSKNLQGSIKSQAKQQSAQLEIEKHPKGQTKVHGEEVVFSVTVKQSGSFSYQWIKDGTSFSYQWIKDGTYCEGATSSSFHISSVDNHHEGEYACIISNQVVSVQSQSAKLVVVHPPEITESPSDQNKFPGDMVVFAVSAASGNGTLSYQWSRNGEDILYDSHSYCEGADTRFLLIKSVLTQYEGSYMCVVSNEAGSVESQCAYLGVVSPTASFYKSHAKDGDTEISAAPRDLVPMGPPKVNNVGSKGEETISGADEGIKVIVSSQQKQENIKVKIQAYNPSSQSESLIIPPPDTKIVSPIYDLSTPDELYAKALIEHYANIQSKDDQIDMKMLRSTDKSPPYKFSAIQGDFTSTAQVGTTPLNVPGRYAIGASTGRQECYTLYFFHPIPMLTQECMYAVFSATYKHPAFKKLLLDEVEQRFAPTKFWPTSVNVAIDKDANEIELVPTDDLKSLGYSVTSIGSNSLKIMVKDLHDYSTVDARTHLPPSLLLYVETNNSCPKRDLECKMKVVGVKDDSATFVLRVRAPPPSNSWAVQQEQTQASTKLTGEDIECLIKILAPYAGIWRKIGSQLGFKIHELGLIESDLALQSKGHIGYLSIMLQEWGKWPCQTLGVQHSSSATLEALEAALSSGAVDLEEVAMTLRQDLLSAKEGKPIQDRRMKQKSVMPKSKMSSDMVPEVNVPKGIHDTSATIRWKLRNIHEKLNGEGIVIAILDTGINIKHIAFKSITNRIRGANFVPEDDPKSWYTKPGTHGSMAAYIAAGSPFNDNVGGVAPKATLMMCRVGDDKKSFSMYAVIQALQSLIKLRDEGEDKLHIVSMSFGMPYNPDDEDQQTMQDLILQLKVRGVICIASAGNYGKYGGVLFPACSEDVLCVGALTIKGYNRQSNASKGIDVFAPGELIVSPSMHSNESVVTNNGSSCAAPAIAGLTALVLQYGNQCVTESYEKKKYSRLLYLKKQLFEKEMKCGDPELLEPYPFFDRYITKYELEKLRSEKN